MTYFTAGYPTPEETVEVMLGMEAGGSGKHQLTEHRSLLTAFTDIIELGLPFTDPIADGPTIQKANTVRTSLQFYAISSAYILYSKLSRMG